MTRSKSSSEKQEEKTPPAPEAGPGWYTWVLVMALLTAIFSIWDSPGVTRPYPAKTVFLGGFCLCASAPLLLRHKPNFRSRLTIDCSLLFLMWLMLGSQFSLDKFRSLQTLASWGGALALFLISSLACTSWSLWWGSVSLLTSAAGALSIYGFATAPASGGIAATFSNADTFSFIPLVAFFLATALSRQSNILLRCIGLSHQVILGLAVIASGCRSSLVGGFFGLVVLIISSQAKQSAKSKRDLKISLMIPALIVIIALISGLASGLQERVGELTGGRDTQGVSMRTDVLVHGLQASTKRPIFGSGPGTFSLAYQEYRPRNVLPEYIYVNVAHDDFVEVMVEFGWVGFFLLSSLMLLVILRAIRLLRHRIATWEASCLLACVGATLGFSCLNFAISVPALLFWELLLLGLLNGLPVGRQSSSRAEKLSPARALLVLVTGAWVAYFGVQAERVNQRLESSRKLDSALRWEEALPLLDESVSIQPSNSSLLTARGTLKARLQNFTRVEPGKGAEADLVGGLRLSPKDIRANQALLQYYQTTKRYDKAEEVLVGLQRAAPYMENLEQKLCRLQLLQGKLEAAATTIYNSSPDEKATSEVLIPILVQLEGERRGAAVSLLGQWSRNEGDVEFALRLCKQLARASLQAKNPSAASRFLELARSESSKDIETLYLKSQVNRQLHQVTKEKEVLEQILKLKATRKNDRLFYDMSLARWAILQPDFGLLGATARKLEQHLKDQPESTNVRLLLSEFYLLSNQPDPAAEVITKGIDLSPDEPYLLARLGTCTVAQGLPEMAQGYFDQALKLQPSLREAKFGKMGLKPNWSELHRRFPVLPTKKAQDQLQ